MRWNFHLASRSSAGERRCSLRHRRSTHLAFPLRHPGADQSGTKVGDLSETLAIKQVFGSHARALPVSATKALHGHLMGATGAVEMVVALAALRSGTLPPTAHLQVPDPECDLDYIAEGARQAPGIAHVMSNSFGFGGSNAVIVASRAG